MTDQEIEPETTPEPPEIKTTIQGPLVDDSGQVTTFPFWCGTCGSTWWVRINDIVGDGAPSSCCEEYLQAQIAANVDNEGALWWKALWEQAKERYSPEETS